MKNEMIRTKIRLFKKEILITVLLFVFSYPLFNCLHAKVAIDDLKCEYLNNPIGIDVQNPRFTWVIKGSEGGYLQDSYQLCIATSPQSLHAGSPDVWNSGKVKSTSNRVVYSGPVEIKSHQKYFWYVITKDSKGKEYRSEDASFEMGKMNLNEWKAQWISDHNDKEFRPSPLFRRSFNVGKKIATARAYVSGLGYYELYLNGKRVGNNMLDPGYTHFDKRVLYVTHDITSLLQTGDNCAVAVLGNGWFNVQSRGVWDFEKARWRNRPQLLCEIRITYKDGSVETIGSDQSWKTSTGAYLFNNIYSGDIYDARLEKKGWKLSGFDDSQWTYARCV
ncbi:MAG: alpha-L-rhamnosidase N-terminal domain-containing protein, partial [Bacteroidales bacterium]|nr:alpha-L-rhamnosidase N-terminal domain-containing protein [Bacteroidales bacterium]